MPRVLKRVPARFRPKRDIKDKVTNAGDPLVGGAGKAIVETPTYP